MIFLFILYLMGIPLSYAIFHNTKFIPEETLLVSLLWFVTIPAMLTIFIGNVVYRNILKLEKHFKTFLDKFTL